MFKAVFLPLGVAALLSIASAQGLSEAERIVRDNNLKVVDYNYVLKRIGDGRLGSGSAIILDARPEVKYMDAHIPSAHSMPYPFPENKRDEYIKILAKKPKDSEIITYCGGIECEKSPNLALELMKLGYKNVKIYSAGIQEWKKHFYTDISTKAAKALFDKDEALFIDARPVAKFKDSTIVGSLGISDSKFDTLYKRLPLDTNLKMVVFCGGMECELSHSVAAKMVAMGYKNVMTYSGGVPEWKKLGYPMTGGVTAPTKPKAENEIRATKNAGPIVLGEDDGTVDTAWFNANLGKMPANVTIVDIRGASDYEKGHFANARNIERKGKSVDQFAAALSKDDYIILTCSTGTRSLETWMELSEKFKDRIFYLDAMIKCDSGSCKAE
ncbi:MAG: rhodanese-like domain-containing protein [Wolinella sp.]